MFLKNRKDKKIRSGYYRVLKYRGTENLGDAIQTVALCRLLDKETVGVYRDEAYKSIDNSLFVVNGWLGDRPNMIDKNTVFSGVHIASSNAGHAYWARQSNQKVGCRDQHTLDIIHKFGVDGMLVGCATLTLPPYSGVRGGEYSIDCDRGGKLLTQWIDRAVPWHDQWKMAIDRLDLLGQAALVHTTRLHVALPCLAMGTPVTMHESDTQNIFQPQRLKLLEALNFRYNVVNNIEDSNFREIYIKFLGTLLKTTIKQHNPVAPI